MPLALVAASLLQETTSLYDRIQSGELSMGRYFARVRDALPAWVLNVLDRFGLMRGSNVLAGQAINIGQNTLDFVVSLFVMLYLLFFLLRDAPPKALSASPARAARPTQGRSATPPASRIAARAFLSTSIAIATIL